MTETAPRGQVLVIFAILIVILIAFAGLTIDIGRQVAERRHVQTAADAAALAACQALIDGETDTAAATEAQLVAMANLQGSPAAATATIDSPPTYDDLDNSGTIDAHELVSGIVIAGTTVRVAIFSTVETLLARVVGISSLETGAGARCDLQGSPAVPIVARRYSNPPGPGNGFVDHLATLATSGSGEVSDVDPRGYDVRIPAGEGPLAGPQFSIYGNESKAHNDSSFRGFVALDVRNFEGTDTRVYYNGVNGGMNDNTLKDIEGEYLVSGYPGPAFPAVSTPPNGDTQVAVLSGNSTSFVVQQFDDSFKVGDRVLLGVYDGTVMEIPDFAISPPVQINLPSTTVSPVNGPTFEVSKNQDFLSTVTMHLHGDEDAAAAGHPEFNLIPDPSVIPPAAGQISAPTFTPNTFEPTVQGVDVAMNAFHTNAVPPGIYTAWLEGHSGDPYFQRRRVPVPVVVQTDANNDGDYNDAGDIKVTRDFSLVNSVLDGSTGALNGTITMPIYVMRTSSSATRWDGGAGLHSPVALSWDADSFSDCGMDSTVETIGIGSIGFSSTSVTPTTNPGALSTLTINTNGLTQGCYLFTVRAQGTNGDGQPVTHLATVRFTVATTESSGQYVDIIGFAVFQVSQITANDILGYAVSGIYADPNDLALRRAQKARLVPWS
jgi:Flp pilus assembly protein TadG